MHAAVRFIGRTSTGYMRGSTATIAGFVLKGTVVLHRDGLGAKPWQRECQGWQFPYRIHWKGDYKIKTKTDKLRE
jgi:hypothetical protein